MGFMKKLGGFAKGAKKAAGFGGGGGGVGGKLMKAAQAGKFGGKGFPGKGPRRFVKRGGGVGRLAAAVGQRVTAQPPAARTSAPQMGPGEVMRHVVARRMGMRPMPPTSGGPTGGDQGTS